MAESRHSLREWTADLQRRLARFDDPDSLTGIILRRQIEFNRAVLQRREPGRRPTKW